MGAACVLDVSGCGSSGDANTGNGSPDSGADGSLASGDGSGSGSDGTGGGDSAQTTADATGEGDAESTDAAGGSDADAGAASDANLGEASDGGPGDASDGSANACSDGNACTLGSQNGICTGGACVACDSGGSSAGPDTSCTSAYGFGTNPYVCSAGSCIPGNCNSSADCTAPTSQCGFPVANFCGGCTSDSQCTGGNVCNLGTGACVAATSGCTTGVTGGACSVNSNDVCCGVTGTACTPGNCCLASSACTGGTSCVADQTGESSLTGGGVCTACAAVTGSSPVYVVDPIHGSDATGQTGSAACAFATITRALQVIGNSPPAGTTIQVVNSLGDAGASVAHVTGVTGGTPGTGQELFPIILPANLTITTAGGPVEVDVPAPASNKSTSGFVLSGSSSGIAGGAGAPLTLDGQAAGQTGKATYGVVVQSSSGALSNVTITNFGTDGILVSNSKTVASALAIGAGVQSNGNGVDGLTVSGSSSVTITGGAAQITFNGNAQHGIFASGTANLMVTGTVGTPASSSSVVASGNALAGVWIQSAPTTQSVLNGIAAVAGSANGLRIVPGSNIKVVNSAFLGNAANGIDIENGKGATSSAIGNINLGTDGSGAGNNVVQASTGGNANAGICLLVPATADVQLSAKVNIFGAAGTPITCTGAGGAALDVNPNLACGGQVDVGGTIVHGDAGAGNTINVTTCTY